MNLPPMRLRTALLISGLNMLLALTYYAGMRGWRWVPLACFYVEMPMLALLFEPLIVQVLPGWRRVLPLVAAQALLGVIYNNDLALILAWQHDGGATLPYSPLWFALDPFWNLPVRWDYPLDPQLGVWTWTAHAYLAYLLLWQLGGLLAMNRLRRAFTPRYAYWAQVLNVMLVVVHNPQSVVPAQFLYLAPALLPLLGVAALIKLPLGWSPDLGDAHWACLTGKITQNYGVYHVACGHFLYGIVDVSGEPSLSYNFMVYFTMALAVLLVLRHWWRLGPHVFRIPLPRGRVLAFTANKGSLALGAALWRDQK